MHAYQIRHSYPAAVPAAAGLHANSVGFDYSTSSERSDLPSNHEGKTMVNSLGAYSRKIRGENPRDLLGNREVALQCQAAFRAAYGNSKSTAKEVADDAGQSPRAAENWVQGINPPSLTAFLNAYHNNPVFRAHARRLLLQEMDHDPEFEAEQYRFMQACAKRAGGWFPDLHRKILTAGQGEHQGGEE